MADIYTETANLPPSTEILEFYREKIKEHDNDKEELFSLLEKYQKLGSSSAIEKEREQLVSDLAELKSALSDVNVFIHAERQQVASLHLENGKLKREQIIWEKKIVFLLDVCGFSEDQLIAYLRAPRKRDIVQQLSMRRRKKGSASLLNTLKDDEPSEVELFLKDKVELLEEHFRIARSSWVEEKNVLLEERTLQKAEAKAQRDHDQAHINLLNAKLEDAQRLISEATKKAVEAKTEMHKSKNLWLTEKDKLMTEQQRLRGKLAVCGCGALEKSRKSASFGDLLNVESTCESRQLKRELSATKRQLKEAGEMKSLFEKRCRKLETELSRVREQRDAQQTVCSTKLKKMTDVNLMLRGQGERSEQRRKLQLEGFTSELMIVKKDFYKLTHHFYKMMRLYTESEHLPDVGQMKDLNLATSLSRNINHAFNGIQKSLLNAEIKSMDTKVDLIAEFGFKEW